ncbi:NAD-dependent epimerase/dehydratase family protein [Ancylomarina longa]|uniref:NAD-dependent epimerase/dehydratase family protein n=1 Tax=Ancylomarina longa TaxID=2487017 RepID=A0A434B043_9BACT|nr:NAD-dependent epimerase/dehydratase family protein [Ancylomarina longa]RUT80125.1 NAD-dependent epimerase/dehydratase family protein [Ancylomarina longa]
MKQFKILITGISGFVGRNLVNYLAKFPNYKLYGLDIIDQDIDGVEHIYSWSKLNELQEFDVIIHLAGKAHDLKNTSDDKVYFDINYGLTKKIYDWFLDSNCSKFFFMSSVKAVADVVQGETLDEKEKCNPVTAYGKSKLKAEEHILSMNLPLGKSFYIFRPCMIHGPGNKGNLNLLYRFSKSGIPYPLGSFDNKRSFLSVSNLCFIFNEFIINKVDSGIYHLADDDAISTNELIKVISETLNRKARILKLPVNLVTSLAKLGSILHLPLTEERLNKLTENYVVSNLKIKKVLSKTLPVSTREGLVETIKSFSHTKSLN